VTHDRLVVARGGTGTRPSPPGDEVLEPSRVRATARRRPVAGETPVQRRRADDAVRRRGGEPQPGQEPLHAAGPRERRRVDVGRTRRLGDLGGGVQHRVPEPAPARPGADEDGVQAQDDLVRQQPGPHEPAQREARRLTVAGGDQHDTVVHRPEDRQLGAQALPVVRAELAADAGLGARLQAQVDEILEVRRRRVSDVHTWPHCGPPGTSRYLSALDSPGPRALPRSWTSLPVPA